MLNHRSWRSVSDSVESLGSSEGYYDQDDEDRSDGTYSTAQTIYSTTKPVLQRHDTCFGRVESNNSRTPSDEGPQSKISLHSVQTYVSTEPSEVDTDSESVAAFDLLDFEEDEYRSDAIPATPRDFAELFPSGRRLSIHHDDSTVDGNMNLRVDTLVETEWSDQKENLTLFHLKMNDLKSRDCSLRRYCRDSGREVCKTVRKYQKPSKKQRPNLTKSFSSAFNARRRQDDQVGPQLRHLKRNDSGYDTVFAQSNEDDASLEERQEVIKKPTLPSNTIKLEFSNYANVELKRRGAGPTKCYQFEYWGHDYKWSRRVKQDGQFEEISFHLLRRGKKGPLAHIVPVPLTRRQSEEERLKGGWIPPASMWITDEEILSDSPDHADLVVATGLIALVDNEIKRRWHSMSHRQILLPLIRNNSFRLNMEYIGPKRLIDEVFNRCPTSRGDTDRHVR